MNNINVLLLKYFAKILVGADILAAGFLGVLKVVFINVTHRYQLGLGIDVFQMAHAHAAHAYNRFGNGFAGGRLAFADDVARDDADRGRCSDCTTGELTTTEFVLRIHKAAQRKLPLLAVKIKYSNVTLGNSPEERPVLARRILANLRGHFHVECGTFCG